MGNMQAHKELASEKLRINERVDLLERGWIGKRHIFS